eukprot:gene622-15203_t
MPIDETLSTPVTDLLRIKTPILVCLTDMGGGTGIWVAGD